MMIVVDTLRWDHVGCYGAVRDTTPTIDHLAAEGIRFERAYSTAPWTIPSIASMITGLYPAQHGATSFSKELPDSVETLAEILVQNGYATVGVISHIAINSRRNFNQGFDLYLENEARGHGHVSTPGVTKQAVNQLERLAGQETPFFLFVHYFDPHYTYKRHPEIGFAPPFGGRLKGGESIQKIRQFTDLTETEIEFLRAIYDEEIRFTDAGIQQLLQKLDKLGLAKRTLLVITSDHGEEFEDHGYLGHTHSLYDELVRVPLIFRTPDTFGKGTVWKQPVSLVALTPTVLDFLGIDLGKYRFQAESFKSVLLGEGSLQESPVYFEVNAVERLTKPPVKRRKISKKGIVVQGYKLIRDQKTGELEFYDLKADPGEFSNLLTPNVKLPTQFLNHLNRMASFGRKNTVTPQPIILDEEELNRLKGMGYLE